MKKFLFCILGVLACLTTTAQYGTQFDNRGFESWANFGNNNSTIEPVHWHSTKSATGSFTGFLSQQVEPSSQTRPGSKGSRSARIWPVSVVGVTANGNLTNGRMNAGSMSASGTGNYNYTQRSDARFNTPVQRIPDSLAVWVCFRCADPEQEAEVRAVVHGDADFRFVANGTVDPLDQRVATARQHFTRTDPAGGNHSWRRLSIPFHNEGPCTDPRYLLFTVSTNKTPGQGGTADDLYVDDLLLIYNPSIQMGTLEKDLYHPGETITIPYGLEGTMSADNLNKEPNQLIVQLSTANGSFSHPLELGRRVTDVSGSITVTLPMSIAAGEHYRIRMVTTNYPMVSNDNGFDLRITAESEVAEQGCPTVRIFPNPASQFLSITSEEELTGVELFSQSGARVLNHPFVGKEIELSTATLAAGVYTALCHFHRQTLMRKLVIQR